MRIVPGDFDDPQVRELLRLHLAGMHASSPPGSVFALDLSGLQRPDITFLTAWQGERLVGMGALKAIDATSGEIKSMRTHPDHLRNGVAAAILEHLVGLARGRGYRRVSLETGSGEDFEPALALYRRSGFKNGPTFGDYVPSDFNQFLHLDLRPVDVRSGADRARADAVVRGSDAGRHRAADTITLDREGRYRRRVMLTSDGGRRFLLDLPEPTYLADGDLLALDDGGFVRIAAAEENLIEVTAPDATALARLAWHIGNRHTPCEVTAAALYIQPDHVLAEMVAGLGGACRPVRRPFEPEGGAYGGKGPLQAGHHHHTGRTGAGPAVWRPHRHD